MYSQRSTQMNTDWCNQVFLQYDSLYTLVYIHLGYLLLSDVRLISYYGDIESRKLQAIRIRQISTRMVKLYLTTSYEKARHPVELFYFLKFGSYRIM